MLRQKKSAKIIMKSVIISDLDLTLTRVSLMRELSAHHAKEGIISPETSKQREEILHKYNQGLIDYCQASSDSLKLWAGYLKGLAVSALIDDARDFLALRSDIFYPYVSMLRDKYRLSHHFYLVTANFDFVARAVCEIFSLDGYAATVIGNNGGICNGLIGESLLESGRKGAKTESILRRYDASISVGLGDSENDAELLEKVACPVCVNANAKLAEIAGQNGWRTAVPDNILEIISQNLAGR